MSARYARAGKMPKVRPVYVNAIAMAINGARRLSSDDVQRQVGIAQDAFERLLRGAPSSDDWRSLADTANMAETMVGLGLCAGAKARQVVADAQEALAYAQQERGERGTWALRAQEREEMRERLGWLIALHREQLAACSYSEFEQAYQRTCARIAQARAGNAPAGALVVEGELA